MVAVKVTLCPSLEVGSLEVTIVVVEDGLTVTTNRCDKLPL